MKIIRTIIVTIVMLLFVAPFCQSQNIQYSNSLRPKVKIKLDSLYPHATGSVVFNDKYVSDTTQEIEIHCHCGETMGKIVLVFDTNGNFLNKDVYFNSLAGLPDTILSYMKRKQSQIDRFDYGHMVKSINNKGEVRYSINMLERSTTAYQVSQDYILKFKSSGELISKEKEIYAHD